MGSLIQPGSSSFSPATPISVHCRSFNLLLPLSARQQAMLNVATERPNPSVHFSATLYLPFSPPFSLSIVYIPLFLPFPLLLFSPNPLLLSYFSHSPPPLLFSPNPLLLSYFLLLPSSLSHSINLPSCTPVKYATQSNLPIYGHVRGSSLVQGSLHILVTAAT